MRLSKAFTCISGPLLALTCLLTFAIGSHAAEANSAPAAKAMVGAAPVTLKIAIKPAKPFTFKENEQWKGYSVDLWNEVAKINNWGIEWVDKETVPQVLESLQKRETDVAVGALSVTEEREKILDFSHPIYESGLQIVTRTSSAGSMLDALRGLMSFQVLGGLGVLALALIVVSWLLWRLERHHNEESFPKSPSAGLKESIWWSTNTLISGGCENISPTGTAGRLVAVVWMLGGIAFTSYITAVFTSTLTVSRLDSEINGLQDLGSQTVATIRGTSGSDFLKKKGIKTAEFSNLDEAMKALDGKDIKTVVYDAPILRYWLNTHTKESENLILAGEPFARQHYAFGMPMSSERRKEVNEALLQLKASGKMDEINKQWFGANAGGRPN
ncbi:MAG: hypothetical protein RL300_526 [Pseudomonadota bacterium]|jgi:ABC-type amino acid transport substrate-binding protein